MSGEGQPLFLVIETSGRPGSVAAARGNKLLETRALDESRRHARDLAPAVADVLRAAGARPADVAAVLVSTGPGSYTGLRVGVTSAKTFAYATGCRLVAVPTFEAIARRALVSAEPLTVIGDAQQDRIYVQTFRRGDAAFEPATALAVVPFAQWAARATGWITGPGLLRFEGRLPASVRAIDRALWFPSAESVLSLGVERLTRGESVRPYDLEPVYLRPSSAEVQWDSRAESRGPAG